ncbi:MAG: hypothetical protein U9N79_06980, partial [Actinomycetota bacterium]|nr:hypothetical protein [Actinomycetota bacterium]
VYTVKARSWYAGTPSTGFGTHRPVGLAAIGWVVIHFSDSEVAFRSAGIALAIGAVTIMWFAGRSMLSPTAAWIGTGVFAASTTYLRRATEFLNDLTAAGLLLATMFVIWYHFERRPGGWWLVLAAPLAAAAYYVRYGSALGSVLIAVVAAAVWIRELRRSWRQIAATSAAVVVLLVPHFLYAFGETESLFGVLRSASTSLPSGGGGLGDYLGWFPGHLAGTLGAAVMIAGAAYTIVLAILAIRERRWTSKTRTAVFLSATALSFTIALGAFTHGEPRFIFIALMAALLVGGQAIAVPMGHLRSSPHRIVAVALAVIISHAFVTRTDDMQTVMDSITERRGVVVDTGEAVRRHAGPDTCSIRSSYVPQLTWYSTCATFSFTDGFRATDDASYLVLFEHGKRQPDGAVLEAEISRTSGVPIAEIRDPYDWIGDATVYRYEPDR